MKNFAKHLPHYFALIGLMAVGVAGFSLFSYDRGFQTALIIAMAFGYFAWGIVHHLIHKDLYFAVVMEYLAVSILGLVVVLSLIYRS